MAQVILEEVIVSLENYDQTGNNGILINSPRSIEACKRLGLLIEDLYIKPIQQIQMENSELDLNKQEVQIQFYLEWLMFANHIEERRQLKLMMALGERQQILNESRVNGNSQMSRQQFQNQSIIENEKKLLEKLERGKQKEVQRLLESEALAQKMQQDQKKKIQLLQERELERQYRIKQKYEKQKEKRQLYELHKEKQQQDFEMEQQQKAEKLYQKEFEMELAEQEKYRQQEQMRAYKDLLRRQKTQQMKQKMAEKEQMLEDQLFQKLDELQKREQLREQAKLQKQERLRMFQERNKYVIGEKIKTIVARKQRRLNDFDKNMENQLKKNNMRRELIAQRNKIKLIQKRKLWQERHQKFKDVIYKAEVIEQSKTSKFEQKLTEAEQRRLKFEQERQAMLVAKRQEEEIQELKRKQYNMNRQTLWRNKQHDVLNKYAKTEMMIRQVYQRNQEKLRAKRLNRMLRDEERDDLLGQLLKRQEIEKQKIQEKIEQKVFKSQKVLETKQQQQMRELREAQQKEQMRRQMAEELETAKQHAREIRKLEIEEKAKTRPQTGKRYFPPQSAIPKKVYPRVESARLRQAEQNQIRRKYKYLKAIQNRDMQEVIQFVRYQLLEDEQQNEIRRDEYLQQTEDLFELRQLNELFEDERQRARDRIDKLRAKHVRQLQELVSSDDPKII